MLAIPSFCTFAILPPDCFLFFGGRLLRTVLQTSKIPAHFQQRCGFATFCALASPHKAQALACGMVFL
jgi:hypothetical protein